MARAEWRSSDDTFRFPSSGDPSYWIGGEDFEDGRKVVRWIDHLLHKPWFDLATLSQLLLAAKSRSDAIGREVLGREG